MAAGDDTRPGCAPPDDVAALTLGTAGHIDHGKTALITLLTGKNTDRLREERERGISIELGYAELELPGGRRLSVVDVPGHERFVRTMVAGATGVDLFLLVVAADDGVMPQTVEHLAILDLLGVGHGVVALTKIDLVDDELLELARQDVARLLEATPFAGSPVVPVSSRDGRGVPELLAALAGAAAAVAAARREGPPRLPVDRVFALKGIGTVVTGTLWRGELRAGDTVVTQPGGRRAVVRSVQMHDHPVEAGVAGRRVAVNLRGVEHGDIARGGWLLGPEAAAHASPVFDAWIRLLPGARAVKAHELVRMHHGTAQFAVRLQWLDGDHLRGGGEAAAVVRLDGGEAAVEPHDRFILRTLSPAATLGGGEVLDARPRRWRGRAAHLDYLRALRAGDVGAGAVLLAAELGPRGLDAGDLRSAGFTPEATTEACLAATRDGDLERLDDDQRWFTPGTLAQMSQTVRALLSERAAARPERPQLSVAELTARSAPFPAGSSIALLARMAAAGDLVESSAGFALAESGALSDAHELLAGEVARRLIEAHFAPPTMASLVDATGAERRDLTVVLEVLVQRGRAVRADKDLWFAADAVDAARERLCEALARTPQITLGEFRDLIDSGRRDAQALLELFDREGLTRRQGDARVLRRRSS